MLQKFGVALIQKQLDEGLSKAEVTDLYDMLKGVSAIPFEVQSENAVAMGFVNLVDAALMNYDLKPLTEFIREIISDTAKKRGMEARDFRMRLHGVGDIDIYIGHGS